MKRESRAGLSVLHIDLLSIIVVEVVRRSLMSC